MHIRTAAVLLALTTSAAAQQTPRLIPTPRQLTAKADVPLPNGVQILCPTCDADDTFAAADLRDTLAARGIPTANGAGLRITLQRLAQHPDAQFSASMQAEGYTISSTANAATLTGATSAGVFYAAQTLKQLIEISAGGQALFHAADIRDFPAMKIRGLHDDLSRGPVDTLEFQKKIIRTLAAYKDNLYSPYFEHTQQYASNPVPAPPNGSISAADARELVAYAARYHVTIVPEQEAFGHLRHFLNTELYQPLAETPHGAVLAPEQPGSLTLISQMFTELATLYPSPYLHIGGDETDDLGIGQTRAAVDAQGLAPVYLNFVQNIVNTLAPLHKKILFWGDVAQDSPALLKAMPQTFKDSTIALAWGYSPNPRGFDKQLKPFLDAGMTVWVSPSINNYRQIWPNQQRALDDIQQFTRDGQRLGAQGQLNTLWDDDGESLANMNWYGILFGAAAAWQQGSSPIPAFQQAFGPVFTGDTTGNINEAQNDLTAAMALLHDSKVIGDTEGSDGLFWVDPWSKDGQNFAAKMRPVSSPMRLHAERALALIAQARAANPHLRESDAIDAMAYGAHRIDFLGLKFQLADEMQQGYANLQATAVQINHPTPGAKRIRPGVAAQLSDINGVNGRLQDIVNGYSELRDGFAEQWNRSNRPYGLRPVLERYDYTVALWLARIDKVRSAQRQWSDNRTLPPASDIGLPAATH